MRKHEIDKGGSLIMFILLSLLAVSVVVYLFINTEEEKRQPVIESVIDTQPNKVENKLPLYEYPSGATGSLPFDFETGLKGKRIN